MSNADDDVLNANAGMILGIDGVTVGDDVYDYLQTGAFEKGTENKTNTLTDSKKGESGEIGKGIL